ncbi:winged helix-turn-helix transcriptional regulator [Rhizorhapis suberifaciens]|uniref:DNA-binding HxlR family transcriptional regulator n=1 Tax=Rhizorhapis suberifaciens TaxID=13656 RepID=A0A840HQI2_9SPHN|nr:helix-turn-helix domain-containing protein [Rhizorhapis suberifaciens]MBB4639858.1 DNA-binding HxlR family transcriptional regulator [Rhizorhapis suberifaciens]
MKSSKHTDTSQIDKKRWYVDGCGTAFALEMIGERWAILIMRELMFGPRRFSDLRRDLPGISANILTQRLEGLEANQILHRRKLPPPASVQVYELTQWGYEAQQLLGILGRWATRHPGHDPTLPLSAVSLMLSFQTMIDAGRADGMDVRVGFRLNDERFVAHVHDGIVDVVRDEPDSAAATFTGDPTAVAGAVYSGALLRDLEKTGALRIEGDRALAEKFVTLFVLPEKLPVRDMPSR